MTIQTPSQPHVAEAQLKIMSVLVQSIVRENIDNWGVRAKWKGHTLWLGEFRMETSEPAGLGQFELVSFPQWEGAAISCPSELVERLDLTGARERLASELRHCVTNLALARAAAQKRRENGGAPLRFIHEFEQWVVEGHPLHPCAKMRWPLNEEQQRRYAPEYGAVLEVSLLAVHKSLCRETGLGTNQALANDFPELWSKVEQSVDTQQYAVLPVHPYQRAEIIPQMYEKWLADATMQTLDHLWFQAAPLMSFRSLAPLPEPRRYQIKTAVGVRMTNAVRTVSPQAAENGPELSRVLRELDRKDSLKPLHILHEEGGAYFWVDDWDLARNLSVLYRDNPQRWVEENQVGMPAAALIENGPTGELLILEQVRRAGSPEAFVRAYCDTVLPPFLKLLSCYGVALEAHLQNCVVVFEEGRLVRVLYRDFGGVRFHETRLREIGLEVTFHPGSATVVDDLQDLQSKLFYPLFQNHLGEVFRALARHGLNESWAWAYVREVCERTFEALDGPFVEEDRAALMAPFWYLKRVAWMRLHDKVTEYTFSPLLNPMFRSDVERFHKELEAAPEPELAEEFPRWIGQAQALVTDQLRRAFQREGLLEEPDLENRDPAQLMLQAHRNEEKGDWNTLFTEVDNAVANLALILAHRALHPCDDTPWNRAKAGPDSLAVSETLCLTGHNLHPCARTRLGISVPHLLSASAELAARPEVKLVSLPEEMVGWTVENGGSPNDYAREIFPQLEPEQGRLYLPCHAWQCENVLPRIYAEELATGCLRIEQHPRVVGKATAAFRTVIINDDWTIKASVGSQMTSTTRCISHQTALNGPRISALVDALREQVGGFELLKEPCGVHFKSSDEPKSRNLTCVYRHSLNSRLEQGETACSGASLCTVLPEILQEYQGTAIGFMDAYTTLVVPPHIKLFVRYGVALEAHLQNCIVTFRQGAPYRLFVRDWGGMRIAMDRLEASGHTVELAPGSLTRAKSLKSARDKLVYCLFRAHLEEIVKSVAHLSGAEARELWQVVKRVLMETFDQLANEDERAAFLTPTWKLKALTRMRLQPDDGYLYVEHPNPLALGRGIESHRKGSQTARLSP